VQKRASSAAYHQVFSPGRGRRRQRQETQNTHLVLEMEQTLQDNHMFTHIHSTQEEGWHPVGEVIVTHTNSFSKQ